MNRKTMKETCDFFKHMDFKMVSGPFEGFAGFNINADAFNRLLSRTKAKSMRSVSTQTDLNNDDGRGSPSVFSEEFRMLHRGK